MIQPNDQLDDTRIHPEKYKLADQVSRDANEVSPWPDKPVPGRHGEGTDDDPVRALRRKPGSLQLLPITRYVPHQTSATIIFMLYRELMNGFEEWREPYVEPTGGL